MGHSNGSPKMVKQSNSICRPSTELNNFVKDWPQDLTPVSEALRKYCFREASFAEPD